MADLTAADIEGIVRDLKDETQFRDRNAKWQEDRERVFREKAVKIPGIELESEYRTAELLDAADKFTARFLGAPFTINVSAQGPGPKAMEKAQAMENYDYRLVNRWLAAGVFDGPIHDMCGVTGEGWVHLTLNRALLPVLPLPEDGEDDEAYLTRSADVWKEFTEGEKPDLMQLEPIREPETIYYNADRSLIFSRMSVPLAPLQRQYARDGAGGLYGERGKGKGINASSGLYEITTIEGGVYPEGLNSAIYGETVMLYIVETADYIYHLIEDGTPTQGRTSGRFSGKYNQMHQLGCYKNVFGAPGFVWVHARKTNHPSAKHAVHPLTHVGLALAPQVNIMGSIVYSGGVYGEMSRITLKPAPGPEAALERVNNKNLEIELLGNRIIKPPDGWEFDQPNIGVNADTLNAFASLEQKMSLLYPPALGAPQEMNATSGYQQQVMHAAVADVLDPPLANIAAMINRLLGLKDVGIKTINKRVTFSNFAPTDEMGKVARSVKDEITIDPEDIVEVDRSVSFDSMTQYARAAKIESGMVMLEKGLVTEDQFLRDYKGEDDPERFRRQRIMEKARTIGEEAGLKLAAEELKRIITPVAQLAMAESGLLPFVPPRGDAGTGNPGYVSNGAGGQVPVAPAPNPEAEMAMTGGQPGAMQ